MKSVLTVLGIAVAALVLAIALTKVTGREKAMSPHPQEDQSDNQQAASSAPAASSAKPEPLNAPREGVITTVLTIKGKGDVTIEMYPKAAPKTVAQITKLISSGFYNGLRVHRVVPNFVMQFGNSRTRTEGADAPEPAEGSEQSIPYETNNLKHVTGSLGIALKSPRSDTGTSQMFINLQGNHNLDGDYCVFAAVTKGMDVVEKVVKGDTIEKFVVR